MHVAVDLLRLLAVKKALDKVRLRRQGRKRIRADRARAAPAVLEVCVFRNGAQPCLELAVAAKRIKMGVGTVEGLRRELFGDGRISAQGAQVAEHERTVGCKYDIERVHPCPSHLDVLSIRVRCVQKVTADLHFSSAVSEIPWSRQDLCAKLFAGSG